MEQKTKGKNTMAMQFPYKPTYMYTTAWSREFDRCYRIYVRPIYILLKHLYEHINWTTVNWTVRIALLEAIVLREA